jgi:hypothetical protein
MELVTGEAVNDFLYRVQTRLDGYREVFVCTPFLDEHTEMTARDLLLSSLPVRCGVRLVTRPEAAERVLALLPGPTGRWTRYVESHPLLHAKVYCAMARAGYRSEAIVTSANFTLAGMTRNEEFGIRVTSSTHEGRQAIGRIRAHVNKFIQ